MVNIQKKKTAILLLSFLLSVLLLTSVFTFGTLAYPDNDSGVDMGAFPAPGAAGADTEMENNFGHIGTLYALGRIINNDGVIEECNGSVNVNNGTIKILTKTVGTNFGMIERLDGYSILTMNEKSGTVLLNRTTIENNCGSVKENYGTVKMLGGTVDLNGRSGSVIFDGAAGDGAVVCNQGKITVTDTKKIIIDSNEGTVTISGGEVTVRENLGTILLMNNATLHCTDNIGTIDVSEDASVYISDCKNNYGNITFPVNSTGSFSYDNGFFPIIFEGDDGTASVVKCASVYKDVNYTRQSAELVITLPSDYECVNSGAVRDESSSDCWKLTTYVDYGETQYTVVCRKSSDDVPDGYPPENGISPFVWIAVGAVLIACGAAVPFIANRRKNK